MKKLILAAVLAGSMVVMAEEKTSAAPAAPVAAETAKRARPQLTEEQREKMRAQMKARHEKFMAERRAKLLEVIKKYVPDEAKANELQAELEKVMMGMRRPMGAGRPQMKRATKAPATAK